VGKIDVCEEPTWCVAYSDQGKELLVGSRDRNLYRCEAKPDAKAEVVAKGTDWITQLAVSPSGKVAAAEVGGRLHFPTTGGTDSMDAKSGVWALCWNGDGQLFAGTRKDGIVIAGRSWTWTEPKPAAAEPPAEASTEEPKVEEKEAAEAEPAAPESEPDKASEDKPAGEEKPSDSDDKNAANDEQKPDDNNEKEE
jgi:hypothetical protein